MSAPTALLVGYNGANNTGAEALLQADIADLRAVLGRRGAAAVLGVTAPITATADNAFNFQPDPQDADWLEARWPEGAGAVGLALVDFSRFPVMVRPWGRREDCYRWPYYFAHSPARRRTSRALAEGYAALADRIVARQGRVALIGMEELGQLPGRLPAGRRGAAPGPADHLLLGPAAVREGLGGADGQPPRTPLAGAAAWPGAPARTRAAAAGAAAARRAGPLRPAHRRLGAG